MGRTSRIKLVDHRGHFPRQLSKEAIERAAVLVDMNTAHGCARDDAYATITTGGMIGDVAALFHALQAATDALRSYQHGHQGGSARELAKNTADYCAEVIAMGAYEGE